MAREGREGEGWTKVFAGGPEWGVVYGTDKGYAYRPHNLGGNIPALSDFLEEYDALHLHPLFPGDPCWRHDPVTGVTAPDPNLSDEVCLVLVFSPVVFVLQQL